MNRSLPKPIPPADGLSPRWAIAALVLIVVGVFGQTWNFSFVALDDNWYVYENPMVLSGLNTESINWAFTTAEHASFGQPLVWLSLMLDAEIWGTFAGGYHLTNVALHLANTLLLFGLVRRWGGTTGESFLIAGLFAVHPLHVESVAWISERKDVLSTLFGLISLEAYSRYANTAGRTSYVIAWCAMAASLLSKHMLVTLPVLFLLLDVCILKRSDESLASLRIAGRARPGTTRGFLRQLGRLTLEKLPFLALSAAFCGIALYSQSVGGALKPLGSLTLFARLVNALQTYAAYLGKSVWPAGLAVFYPHPGESIDYRMLVLSMVVLAACSVLAVRQAGKRPYLLFGWLWFLVTLWPVIGLVQIGSQARADRYTYVPLIGIFFAIIRGCASISVAFSMGRVALQIVAATALAGYAAVGFLQVGHWKDSPALFAHALKVTSDNWFVHASWGAFLVPDPARRDEAESHLRESIRLYPHYAPAHFNLGLITSERGRLAEANIDFFRAISLQPDYSKAHFCLLLNLVRLGDTAGYQQHLRALPENLRRQFEELEANGSGRH